MSEHKYQKQIDSWKRDEAGFLPNIEYHFKPDNRIDWRKMIPLEYLVPNKERFPANTDFSTIKVEELPDDKLLILLNGIRRLADIRGFKSVTLPKLAANDSFAFAAYQIELLPNYETNALGDTVVFTGEADAHPGNTNGFGKNFLTTIAGNRAFVRAWRNALGIEILGKDEMGTATTDTADIGGVKPQDNLADFLKQNKVKFENFKNLMIKNEIEGAENWTDVQNVPTAKVFETRELVRRAIEAKKAKQAEDKSKEKNPPAQ
jgi:hypothetical protein